MAIARSYLALDGLDVILIPSFTEVNIADQVRTALRLVVECRQPMSDAIPEEERRGSRQFLERATGMQSAGANLGIPDIATRNGRDLDDI